MHESHGENGVADFELLHSRKHDRGRHARKISEHCAGPRVIAPAENNEEGESCRSFCGCWVYHSASLSFSRCLALSDASKARLPDTEPTTD